MIENLNPLLHARLRLGIMSFLIGKESADFNELKEITKATSGNLSVQLKKLEEAKYITITKGFKNNYQHTELKVTKKGLKEFEEYVDILKKLISK